MLKYYTPIIYHSFKPVTEKVWGLFYVYATFCIFDDESSADPSQGSLSSCLVSKVNDYH